MGGLWLFIHINKHPIFLSSCAMGTLEGELSSIMAAVAEKLPRPGQALKQAKQSYT